ncbi:MAG TPA: hypothetical protein ENN99_13205, partial [Chloroflexi bacterium]|nr:hypothetical protein [Chloroflexota bacterium]
MALHGYSLALLLGPAPAPLSWKFDVPSALIGAVLTLLLAGLAYRFREKLRATGEEAISPLTQLYDRLEATTEERYYERVAVRSQSLVLPAHAVSLDSIFVAPILHTLP